MSSWKNPFHQTIVSLLRGAGHTVYDYRKPAENVAGFRWEQLGSQPEKWSESRCINELGNPQVARAVQRERTQIMECDAVVLVLPSGRDAHMKLGMAMGLGKRCYVLTAGQHSPPELMYSLCAAVVSEVSELIDELADAPLAGG